MGALTNADSASASGETPTTVLVVDDDVRLLAVTAAMLLAQGYRVFKARTPEEAIRIFEQRFNEIDLLLSDVQMPGMSGPELKGRLCRLRPELPVVFMTGNPDQITRLANVLEKPFRLVDLYEIIVATLGGSQRQLTVRSWLDNLRR